MKYIKSLDAIRAIAVMLVIASHWLHYKYIDVFDLGFIGVNIFFVLSGFLITRILLESKKDAESNGLNKFGVAKSFFIRRTLRIFPIYYLTVFALFILGEKTGTTIRDDFSYFVFYASNILFFIQHDWGGNLSHLWSLAVEEQFYLIWPWLILFIRPKYLHASIISFFLVGVFSNYIIAAALPQNRLITVFTPTCFDSFSLGALLSYFMTYKPENIKVLGKVLSYLWPFCLLMYVIASLYSVHLFLPQRTLISIPALYLIYFTIYHGKSILHKGILNFKPLIFIGKISYGIYLYHNFVPWIWKSILLRLDALHLQIPFINSNIPRIIYGEHLLFMKLGTLFLISWLSWTLIEHPINKLKDRFTYKQTVKQYPPKVILDSQQVATT